MINIINTFLNTLFDILLFPFKNLNAFWAILFVSSLTGIVMLFIFKKVSNQKKIHQVKNKIKAYLLELRLYNDDISLSLFAAVRLFTANLSYFVQVIRPLIVLFIPVSLILIQIGSRYGNRPLKIQEQAIVSVTVKENIPLQKISLSDSGGISIETDPVRIPAQNKIYWRIKGVKKGIWHVHCIYDTIKITKRIVIDTHSKLIAGSRKNKYSISAFLNPGEKTLPDNQFLKEITVHYPYKPVEFAGLHIHWLVLFFILSIAFGFAFKGFLGVEI
ncbi:MAG: hypothetical protein R6V04_12140 [bacterium]